MTILVNQAMCKGCGKILQSTHVHDYREHECPGIWFMVDGGLHYVRRGWKAGTNPSDNYIEKTVYTDENPV